MGKESESLFEIAQRLQYKYNNPEEAYKAYLNVINRCPGTPEEQFALNQLEKLEKIVNVDNVADELVKSRLQDALEIRRRKEQMILTTCPSVEGHAVTKQLGLVCGECVYKTGFVQAFASIDNYKDMFSQDDNELSDSMKLLSDARNYATNRMIEDAVSRGANAVIGIDSESTFGGDIMHITIFGTAVYVE